MKKTIALLMAISILFSLVGCDNKSYKRQNSPSKVGPRAESVVEKISSENESKSENNSESKTTDDTSTNTEKETTSSKTSSEDDSSLIPKSVKDPGSIKMSDNLFDYTVEIEGKVYQLPMTVNDFLADGWEFVDGHKNDEIYFYIEKNGKTIQVDIKNYNNRKLDVKYCYIVGFIFDLSLPIASRSAGEPSSNLSVASIKLSKDIELEKSTIEDVKKAYGEPNENYNNSYEFSNISYSEKENSFNGYEFNFSNNKLCRVYVKNIVDEPDNFVKLPVNYDDPYYITDYKAPTELGDDILSGNVQIDNVIYKLPCPLKLFLNNGWELKFHTNKIETVQWNNEINAYITKDNCSIRFYAHNLTDYEIPIENTLVECIYISSLANNNFDFKLPGNFDFTTTEEQLKESSIFKCDDYEREYIEYYAVREGAEKSTAMKLVTATFDKEEFYQWNLTFKYVR